MEGAREFLEQIRQRQLLKGHFLGLLHLMIGRRIARADGTVLSSGNTWRQLADLLKNLRWDKEWVRELGLDPDNFPPRDRQRFWFSVIGAANINSPAAIANAEVLARKLAPLGFTIS